MSDAEAGTPRVYLYRHGETEWAKNGRHTGITEIELTSHGQKQVQATGAIVVGSGKLIDPDKIAHIFSSPRKRAVQTYELAFSAETRKAFGAQSAFSTTEKLAEWGYGEYEGLKDHEIRALRREHGLDGERGWDIWRDGCEGGESAQEVTDRMGSLIADIHKIQSPIMYSEKPSDIVLFAHGHLLRAFVKRWLKLPMEFPLSMMLEPGGVGVLSYQNHDVNDPAVLVGIGFPVAR